MIFSEVAEFSKEFKKLAKKYKTLESDIHVFKTFIENLYECEDEKLREIFQKKYFDRKRATELTPPNSEIVVVKARFDCAYLNKDCLRIIYLKNENKIKLIELYNKTDKNREDPNRIKFYQSDIKL